MKNNILIKRLLNPVVIYCLIWCLLLLLFSFRIIDYGNLSNSFYIAFFLSLFGIVSGAEFTNVFIKTKKVTEVYNGFTILPKQRALKHIYKIFLILGFLGVIIAYFKVFTQVSVSTFFNNQAYVKSYLPRSTLAAYLTAPLFVNVPIGVLIYKYYNKEIKYLICPMIFIVLYSLSFWSRLQIMIAVIFLIASFVYLSFIDNEKLISLGRLIIIVIIASVLIYVFMCWTIEFRVAEFGTEYGLKDIYKTNDEFFTVINPILPFFASKRAFRMTYAYLVASFPTLDYWLNANISSVYGQASFPYFFRLFKNLGFINKTIVADQVLGNGLQLPSLIGYAYMDFGFFGILLYTFLLGIFASYYYRLLLLKKDPIYIFYCIWFIALIVFSVQTNMISITNFCIIFIVMFFTKKYLRKEKNLQLNKYEY